MHLRYIHEYARTLISACIFGILIIILISITAVVQIPFSRFDVLFIAALLIQVFLIVFRYEHPEEAFVIGIFHILGTCMELFKTSIGSWQYSGDGFFMIGAVPLFAGFMYASVGSAIARSIRLFNITFLGLPHRITLLVVSACIYANFYTHHFMYDMRYIIIIWIAILFFKTRIRINHAGSVVSLNFLVIAIAVACTIWLAENIATYFDIWRYPHQMNLWRPVHMEKITSWFLLMLVSFTLVVSVINAHKRTPAHR